MEMRARGLSISRGGRLLLQGLDLHLGPGQCWVVLGPNGAGKSTLLLALCGQLPQHSGRGNVHAGSGTAVTGWLELDGKPLRAWPLSQRVRRVAWQGAPPPTEFGLTVEERLQLASDRPGSTALGGAVRRLDLAGLERRRLGELSAGERQRVELAALTLREAPLWLLDEPCSHLDLRHQVSWLRSLAEERDAGRCLVMACHDLGQARALADGAILLHGDDRCTAGPATELLDARTLSDLYGTPLRSLADEGGRPALLAPDYTAAPAPEEAAGAS